MRDLAPAARYLPLPCGAGGVRPDSANPFGGSGALNDRGPSGPSDERISRLSAAILRISQSLELATVLEEVVEGARADRRPLRRDHDD